MKPFLNRGFALGLAMVVSAGIAIAARPSVRLADQREKINLDIAIPRAFGDWRVDPTVNPIAISPDVQARLDQIYNQTLSRTYINNKGERIMLSIAYGGDQSNDDNQVHRPEFCYTAQGFEVVTSAVGKAITEYGDLSVRRLFAIQGSRMEPITYWITIGDKAALPGFSRKLTQIAYGLTGKVPDGMLIRVSSIDASEGNAYRMQDRFVSEMLRAVKPGMRARLVGGLGA